MEGKPIEDEIKQYRDWSWQLVQYLNAIDPGFEAEVQQIMDDPTKALDMTTASLETRTRSSKLYSLLASLCRNRSLSVVKSVMKADGFEALRQLTLTMRPSTSGRGLALMAALTSWPTFNMQQGLQAQVLKLDEALLEAKRAGSSIPDQLQQAILLKCVSGQLRTHLNLHVQEAATFPELREQVLKWDRAQQKWNGLIFAEDSSGAAPMEIDRVWSYGNDKGWSSGKKGSKGKQKGPKGPPKGKSKGKNSKGKDGRDGKGKKGDKGKGYVKPDDRSKGKGKGDRKCSHVASMGILPKSAGIQESDRCRTIRHRSSHKLNHHRAQRQEATLS